MQQFGRLTTFFKKVYEKSYEILKIDNQFLETIKFKPIDVSHFYEDNYINFIYE